MVSEIFSEHFDFRENETEDLKSTISDKKEEISKLNVEREDLMVKIEAGEGANTALTQLKQQNVTFPNSSFQSESCTFDIFFRMNLRIS